MMFCQFLLYSIVTQFPPPTHTTQTHTHIHIFFHTLFSIMFHHKSLDIVPFAVPQDLIAYPGSW